MIKTKIKIFNIFAVLISFLLFFSSIGAKSVAVEASITTFDKSSVIIDYHTGEVIFENNSYEKRQVASIVKLMTILLTIEEIEKGNIKLTDKLTTSENAASMGGSQVFIDPYIEYTVEDMLKGVIVASANDASVALAEHIGGSEDLFVVRMNRRAKELGLLNTLYANSTGLGAPEEYSSALDTAKLLREVIRHPIYHKYSTIWMDELLHPSGRKTEVVNTNKLVRYFKGCDSGKTGFTDEAGYCLTASAERGNLRFIAVSLGAKDSKTRFANVTTLLNYAFSNFENKLIVNKDEKIADVEIKMGKEKTTQLFASENFFALKKKGEESTHEVTVEIPNFIKAPFKKGDMVGKAIVSKDGKVIVEIPIIVQSDIEQLNFKDAIRKVVKEW